MLNLYSYIIYTVSDISQNNILNLRSKLPEIYCNFHNNTQWHRNLRLWHGFKSKLVTHRRTIDDDNQERKYKRT